MKRFLSRFVLPGLITTAAVAGAVLLVRSAESAEREPPAKTAPLVQIQALRAAAASPRLDVTGVVEPAHEATISPELSGRIVELSPSLVLGGRVTQDEVLLRIDRRDYAIAVKQQKAQVEQAKLELELEAAHGSVAKQEWSLMGNPNADGRLASREPQREVAEVKVDAARSNLEKAELALGRTVIRAPFNATVAAESVEEGEVVSPGQVIATLVGTDALWVRVSVPLEYLPLLDIPGPGVTEGSRARVVQRLGTRGLVEREGTVLRLVSQLDAESRTAQVLVEVKNPLDPPPGELPLLPGAHVEVELQGRPQGGVIAVPRVAVVEGHHAWVVDEQQTLHRRTLEIAWGDADEVFVTAGIADGEQVVLTPPSPALEGMQVRTETAPTNETAPDAAQLSAVTTEQAEG